MQQGLPWQAKAGAWFGLGASPGAILVGAVIAHRHGGAAPVWPILVGIVLVAALVWFQGQGGLRPPAGTGGTFTDLVPTYFGALTRRTLGAILALIMVGWFGFNVGLGGAALSALLGLPGPAGPLLLGLPVLALSFGGQARWNRVAVLTTAAAVLLMLLVVLRLAARTAPVHLAAGDPGAGLVSVAALIGYAAVFSLRSPDFAAGLASRRDLAICVALFCVSGAVFVLAGIGLQMGTNSVDLVGILAGSGALAAGNLLVATSVVAPAFTTVFSGSLALAAAAGLRRNQAVWLIWLAGLALAVSRFDRMLGPWLSLLAAALPPLIVPMAAEAALRRRGRSMTIVPAWTWLPASAGAMSLTAVGQPLAVLTGLAAALILTGVWVWSRRR